MLRSLFLCLFVAVASVPFAHGDDSAPVAEPTNLCRLCFCLGLTMNCNYAHNKTLLPIWNSAYSMPSNITAVEIELTKDTQFQLEGGVFRQNRVNRFVVKGPNMPNGNDQVELTQNAFRNNQGGFPDIQIIGVSSVFLRSYAFSGGENKLRVEYSDLVVMFPNAVVNVNMSCTFGNIRSLEIKEKAFNLSTDRSAKAYVKLYIANSNIKEINRFDGSMNKIVYHNCTIESVQSKAFDVTNINQLSFENSRIDRIEAGAFTSKLFSEHVSIIDTQIRIIDTKAINGSGISRFTLRGNKIDVIKEDAIELHSVYVNIQDNTISHQGRNWLHVNNGELIAIEDNRFGNFAGIQLEHTRRPNCTFVNNWLGNPEANSLNFSKCEMRGIKVKRTCNCDDSQSWLHTLTDHDISTELFCLLGAHLERCFNTSWVHMRRYTNEVCGVNRTTLVCKDGSSLVRYKDNFVTAKEREEQQRGISLNTVLVRILIGLSGVSIFFVLIYCLYASCHRKPTTICSLAPDECNILRQGLSEIKDNATIKAINILIKKKLSHKHSGNYIQTLINNSTELPYNCRIVIENHVHNMHSQEISLSNFIAPNTNVDQPLLQGNYSIPADNVYALLIGSNEIPPPPYTPEYATPGIHHSPQPPPPSQVQQTMPAYSIAADATASPLYEEVGSVSGPVWRPMVSSAPLPEVPPELPPLQRHVSGLREDLAASPQFHPNQLSSSRNQSHLHSSIAIQPRQQPPPPNSYFQPSGSSRMRSFAYPDGAASLAAMEHLDMRGAAALPPDSGSDHSGGSDETVKIDDI